MHIHINSATILIFASVIIFIDADELRVFCISHVPGRPSAKEGVTLSSLKKYQQYSKNIWNRKQCLTELHEMVTVATREAIHVDVRG